MARALSEIEKEVLSLSHKERARLAHRLIVSLDEGVEEDVDEYWREELIRRDQQIESGEAEPISAEEALKAAREALKK